MTRQEENQLAMEIYNKMEELWQSVMNRLNVAYDTSQPTPFPLMSTSIEKNNVELMQKYNDVGDMLNDVFNEEEHIN